MKYQLRDYQEGVIDRLHSTLSETNRVILGLATGAGKTVIAAHIAKRWADDGHRVLFVVHLKTLVPQAERHFKGLGLRVGILRGEDTCYSREDDIIVASIQTIARRGAPDWVSLVIIDECHVLHQEHRKLMERWNLVPFVGLSATPIRRGLGAWFDAIVKGPSIQELTDRGHLVPVRAYAPGGEAALEVLNMIGVSNGDYKEADLHVAMKNDHLFGDPVQTYLKHGEGRQAIGFAVRVAHSKDLVEAFNVAGIPAEHIDAFTPEEERAAIFQRFRDGITRVLFSVGVLSIGFDMPQASVAILCRPTLSEMLHFQQVGRVLRPAEGKRDCIILDHAANTIRFGLPQHFQLPDNLNEFDIPTARQVKKEKKLSACMGCGYVLAPEDEFCPHCGTDRPGRWQGIGYDPGELVEVGTIGNTAITMKEFYLQVRGLVEMEGKGREKARGTAFAITKEKFGKKPPWSWRDLEPLEPNMGVVNYVKSRRIAFARSPHRRAA
jgi:superfamily II DNA or RNA helicase/uncharacterized OB-fold protein